MLTWINTGIQLIVELVRGWLSELSRDKANRDAGEAEAKQVASDAALERAENAKEVANEIPTLDDDALDNRMRHNRDAILAHIRKDRA